MELYKQTILTVEDFTTERPDLAIHTNNAIQSAIYQSAALLNGECNGLIEEVWNYMSQDKSDIDPKDKLYRTEVELGFIKEAFIMQTQFTINNSNEFVQGSMNYNASGFNYSQNTPVERDVLAPNVLKVLARAKVYFFNFWDSNDDKKVNCDVLAPEQRPMNIAEADLRYVLLENPYSKPGQILITTKENNSRRVVYKYPYEVFQDADLDINAKRVFDKDTQYRELKDTIVVNELGTYIQNVNQSLTQDLGSQLERIVGLEEQLREGIIFHNRGDWQANTIYYLLDIVRYGGNLYWVKANSTNKPPTDKNDWVSLAPATIDLSEYATIEWVNQQLRDKLTQAQADNIYVKLEGDQSISGVKTFNNNIVLKNNELKFYHNNQTYGTVKKSDNFNRLQIEAGPGGEVSLKSYSGGNIVIDNNNNVWNEKAPSNNNHLTNKSYVDNADRALRNEINNIRDQIRNITNYSPTVTYGLGDTVFLESNQEFYISTQNNNTGNDPTSSPDYWKWLTNSVEGGDIDLSNYLSKPEAEQEYAKKTALNNYYTRPEADNKFLTSDNLNGYATEQWVLDKNYAPKSMLNNYVLTQFLLDNYYNQPTSDSKYVQKYLPSSQNQRINAKTYFDQRVYFKTLDNTGWIEFQKVNNARYGLIGKASSNSDRFQIWADDELLLFSGKPGGNVIVDERNNVLSAKEPTHNYHLTNKAYVDSVAGEKFKTVKLQCEIPMLSYDRIENDYYRTGFFIWNATYNGSRPTFTLPQDLQTNATLVGWRVDNLYVLKNDTGEALNSGESNVISVDFNKIGNNRNDLKINVNLIWKNTQHITNINHTKVTLDLYLTFVKSDIPIETISVTHGANTFNEERKKENEQTKVRKNRVGGTKNSHNNAA